LPGGLFNLAMVLHSAGHDTDAEPLALRALALRQQQYGKKHGLVGVSLGQLGEIKLAENDPVAAERLLQQALATLDAATEFGQWHTATGRVQLALARLRVAQQRPNDAQTLITDIQTRFVPVDAEHRRLLWASRTLAAQMQCAQPHSAAQGRRALLLVRDEIAAEIPASVIARETTSALHACGG